MERSSRFVSLSGYSGIFAGIFALTGGAVAYLHFQNSRFLMGGEISHISGQLAENIYRFLIIDGGIILVLAICAAVIFSRMKAKKQGLPIWDQTTERVLTNLSIPLISGGIFIAILAQYKLLYFLPPVSLLFYGMALLNAGNYTLSEVRYLGLAETITGILSLIFLKYSLYFWIFGFGILHIVYGVIMFRRYDKTIN